MDTSPRRVAASVDELPNGAVTIPARRLVDARPRPTCTGLHHDGRSGARLQAVPVDGDRLILKHVQRADDWIGAHLLPAGPQPLTPAQHLRFLDHVARMHATFWQWHGEVGLMPLAARYLTFCPQVADVEAQRGTGAVVPRLIGEGWRAFPDRAPRAADVVLPLLDDPGRCSPPWRRRPRRWCTATGSRATWAWPRTGARSCSTGPCRAWRRRAATWRGIWR